MPITDDRKLNDAMARAIPASVLKAISALESAGFEAWAVGGCVRDVMLGKDPHDWDLTTSATPAQMKKAMPFKSFDTGIQHGTVTFLVDGEPIETTVYRTEGVYSDGRHPDSIEFASTLEEDLSRRDFTMNAMAWSPTRGLADPYGGADDLDRGELKCVRNANERFDEDGLRVMRALRFASVYGLTIEEKTARAIHAKKGNLENVSAERIQTELSKMLAAPDGKHLASTMDEFCDVVFEFAPELEVMYGYDQANKHHDSDLWHHSLDTMANVENDPDLRLAALVHDIGKPECRSIDEDGQAHYLGHMKAGKNITENMMRRLKYPNSSIDDVAFLVSVHDERPAARAKSARRFLAKCGSEEKARRLLKLMNADASAHDPQTAETACSTLRDFEQLMNTEIEKSAAFSMKDMDFSGNDLIAMGWKPGREMGTELARLFEKVVDGDVPNSKKALITEVQEHARAKAESGARVYWTPETQDQIWVEGYVRSDGVKVRGHWRHRSKKQC